MCCNFVLFLKLVKISTVLKGKKIKENFRKSQGETDLERLAEKIEKGDLKSLSSGISTVERQDQEGLRQALKLMDYIKPSSKSIRLGISGVPGAGKSTFIESFGLYLVDKGYKLAVLSIDPSSSLFHGSILGDKTRMQRLSQEKNAFIRPSPSASTLGGISHGTGLAMELCEAAGYDFIIVETVGVGQNETALRSLVDFFLLLKVPYTGDELQGIKRGILEISDAIAINKIDQIDSTACKIAKSTFESSLHILPNRVDYWNPPVLLSSGLKGDGLKDILDTVLKFYSNMDEHEDRQQDRLKKHTLLIHERARKFILTRAENILKNDKSVQDMARVFESGKIGNLDYFNRLVDYLLKE